MTAKQRKKRQLRNNEYYNTQDLFDNLYDKSLKDGVFTDLLSLIKGDANIELAYRNIKANKGSKTSGINRKTIEDLQITDNESFKRFVINRLDNFQPHSVRRIEIPKKNGKTRPLGIPTIEDRIIQQCIKQVMEPICEAKFHKHSYGFRPNRGTSHALARTLKLGNDGFHYVVDIDIKGFFDNIDHGKLLKQIWTMGIRDKNLICIIGKMLKAPIEGIGVPQKGTPQGGILSPLLSNIVLNELDWWLSNQWADYKPRKEYAARSKYQRLRNSSNLKEFFHVRYADDFKIMCKDYNTAKKIFIATKKWLKERLGLDISEEKSKIVNIRKNYSEFLGFKMKAKYNGKKNTVRTSISNKAIEAIKKQLVKQVDRISKDSTGQEIMRYNSKVLGIQNYYRLASTINRDLGGIAFTLNKNLRNKLKNIWKTTGSKSRLYLKLYGQYNYKTHYISGIAIFPLKAVKSCNPMNFSQETCNYTALGREKVHNKLTGIKEHVIQHMLDNPVENRSVEYNDNRISLYVGQLGKCSVTGHELSIGNFETHHIIKRCDGGDDSYRNLSMVKTEIHKLIHATDITIINKYLQRISVKGNGLKKLNKFRKLAGNFEI